MPIRRSAFKKKKRDVKKGRDKKKRLRKKFCKLCVDRVNIDYRDVSRLQRFVTEKGKIISRRMSGNCCKCQRKLSLAIKRARQVALVAAMVR